MPSLTQFMFYREKQKQSNTIVIVEIPKFLTRMLYPLEFTETNSLLKNTRVLNTFNHQYTGN